MQNKNRRSVHEIPAIFSYLESVGWAHCGGRYRGYTGRITLRATDTVRFYGNQRFLSV